jgi:hypothetical protein
MRSRFFWEVWYLLICKPKKKEGLEGDNFLWFFFWAWYSCEMQEVSRVLYGCNCGEVLKPLPLHNTLSSASVEQNFDVQVSTCWFPWSFLNRIILLSIRTSFLIIQREKQPEGTWWVGKSVLLLKKGVVVTSTHVLSSHWKVCIELLEWGYWERHLSSLQMRSSCAPPAKCVLV